MTSIKDDLIAMFHADHRDLGTRLHHLALRLRDRDLAGARESALALDEAAGAHIAFEEQDFYPLLRESLGDDTVERLFSDHRRGLNAVVRLADSAPDATLSDDTWAALLADIEAMETHIAECGELFATIAAMPESELSTLLARLKDWRRSQPRWRDLSPDRDPDPASGQSGHAG